MTKQLDLPPWLQKATQRLGIQEIKGAKHNAEIIKWLDSLGAWWKNDEEAWCGTFVAICLKDAGLKYPKNWFRALAYQDFGVKLAKPAVGAIAVKSRKGGGHVCFVVGKTDGGKLVCIGGNQNDGVTYAIYNPSDFVAFVWPSVAPLKERFNLPVMNKVTSTAVSEA